MQNSSAAHPIPPEDLKHDYPAHVFPPHEYRPPDYLIYLERAAAAIKTIRLLVYTGMIGFLLVAAYGFFLIYELTVYSHQMLTQMVRMTEQMQSMTRIMNNMYESIADMRDDIRQMRVHVGEMDQSMSALTANINHMANTVALIQHSTRNIDANVGPAANMMNSFMPWSRGGFFGAPPAAPPAPQ
jgi:uncharacterized protein YoxC